MKDSEFLVKNFPITNIFKPISFYGRCGSNIVDESQQFQFRQ
jgi:hypothetical protein